MSILELTSGSATLSEASPLSGVRSLTVVVQRLADVWNLAVIWGLAVVHDVDGKNLAVGATSSSSQVSLHMQKEVVGEERSNHCQVHEENVIGSYVPAIARSTRRLEIYSMAVYSKKFSSGV